MRHQNDYLSDCRPGPWQRRVGIALVLIALALVALFSLGCANQGEIVTTKIRYDRTQGVLEITSPKDTRLGSLTTHRTATGEVDVTLSDYASHANEAAIQAQAAQAQAQLQLINLLSGLVKAGTLAPASAEMMGKANPRSFRVADAGVSPSSPPDESGPGGPGGRTPNRKIWLSETDAKDTGGEDKEGGN